MLAIPILGFGFFVIHPGPAFDTLLIPAVLIPIAFVLALMSRRQMIDIASGKPVSHRDFTRQGMVALAARLCLILAVTGYLLGFEPWFAAANIVANLVWAALWVPDRWRQARAELGIEIPAPPNSVWNFITDVSNWPAYQVGVVAASAEPAGPLRVGSTVTVRRKLAVQRPAGSQFDANVTLLYQVTDLVDGRSYTTEGVHRTARSTTSIEPAGAGTRLTVRSRFWNSPAEGYMGTALQLRWALSEFRRTTQQSLDRLRQVMG